MSGAIFFQTPWILWLVLPAVAAGLIYLLRGRDRLLVISRMIVICLLIVALAILTLLCHTRRM